MIKVWVFARIVGVGEFFFLLGSFWRLHSVDVWCLWVDYFFFSCWLSFFGCILCG